MAAVMIGIYAHASHDCSIAALDRSAWIIDFNGLELQLTDLVQGLADRFWDAVFAIDAARVASPASYYGLNAQVRHS